MALLSLTVFAACDGKGSGIDDFNQPVYSPEYALGFDIKGAEGRQSTIITSFNPWQGADSVVSQLLIVRGGEPVPAGFAGQVLEGEARRIVAMSSSHVAMLDAVGAAGNIVGVSGLNFISSPTVRTRPDSVGDVGYDSNIDYELLVSLDPDIVLLYGVDGASSMEGKLAELGIPYMYVGDYVEESPLGKAEWLVALSEITGRRAPGEKRFADICGRYRAMKQKVSDAAADAPTVMLNTPYNDTWFMPSVKNYMVRLISDAGGAYIYDKNTGNTSLPVDLEEAYLLASRADIWLNLGSANSLAEVARMCPKFTDARCFRNGRVYNNNARSNDGGGNDFWESAIVNPDIVLRDLVRIFHPELVGEDFVYYKQLK